MEIGVRDAVSLHSSNHHTHLSYYLCKAPPTLFLDTVNPELAVKHDKDFPLGWESSLRSVEQLCVEPSQATNTLVKKNFDFNRLANDSDAIISAAHNLSICEKILLFNICGISLNIVHS